jgi:hypothetical protein
VAGDGSVDSINAVARDVVVCGDLSGLKALKLTTARAAEQLRPLQAIAKQAAKAAEPMRQLEASMEPAVEPVRKMQESLARFGEQLQAAVLAARAQDQARCTYRRTRPTRTRRVVVRRRTRATARAPGDSDEPEPPLGRQTLEGRR